MTVDDRHWCGPAGPQRLAPLRRFRLDVTRKTGAGEDACRFEPMQYPPQLCLLDTASTIEGPELRLSGRTPRRSSNLFVDSGMTSCNEIAAIRKTSSVM